MADRPDFEAERQRMVQQHLTGRDIADPRVLEAMGVVPREEFVPEATRAYAYADRPHPIGQGQTISQPYVVALMAQVVDLEPGDRVLEVGTGSGYGAAVLGQIVAEVHTVERDATLAASAAERLGALGYSNVHVHTGDGSLGWPDAAPYDAVVVTAAGPGVPPALVDQLVEGGRLVMPLGGEFASQKLIRGQWRGGQLVTVDLGPVAFVPLVGAQGWRRRYRPWGS